MKAVRIHEHGGPEVLRYEDAPEPQPRADEVVVRVKACSLNHLDLWVRRGLPGLKLEMPHIPGSDAAGEVVEVGPACDQVKVGDRVLVAPGKSSRRNPFTAAGRDNYSPDYGLFGHHYPGLQAEYVAIPEVNALPIPGDLDFERAASIPLVFLTAWHMLVGIARVQMCEDVLIIGGSSGVGIAAIQIARLFHCRVIATAGGEEKMARARELGADFVIDHYQQNIRDEVRRLTNRRGVDIVIEHVGKATWEHSAACLAHHGRLVTCGATTGANVPLSLAHLFAKHLSLNGSFMGPLGELYDVLKVFDHGLLKPVIDRTFPMSEIRAAHERLESKERFGKIVVVP
jgi:NADPH:quinone reductase-like Zn-dependent oxidoreductase